MYSEMCNRYMKRIPSKFAKSILKLKFKGDLKRFLNLDSRVALYDSDRQVGKTTVLIVKMLHEIAFSEKVLEVIVCTPVQTLAHNFNTKLIDILNNSPYDYSTNTHTTTIYDPMGTVKGKLHYVYTTNRIRGLDPDLIIGDEYHYFDLSFREGLGELARMVHPKVWLAGSPQDNMIFPPVRVRIVDNNC